MNPNQNFSSNYHAFESQEKVKAGAASYLGFEDDFEPLESTYHSNDQKLTPMLEFTPGPEVVSDEKLGQYFLRSSVVKNARTATELEAPIKQEAKKILAIKTPQIARVVTQQEMAESPCTPCFAKSVRRQNGSLLNAFQADLSATSDTVLRTKKVPILPPVKQTFSAEPLTNTVTLDIAKMKSLPPSQLKNSSFNSPSKSTVSQKLNAPISSTKSFLMIKEAEFPALFAENPVVKRQKMSRYFDEQDYNSDCETIERNKGDLLGDLFKAIDKCCKQDPAKHVSNLKKPGQETDVSTQAVTPIILTRSQKQDALKSVSLFSMGGESYVDTELDEIDLVAGNE